MTKFTSLFTQISLSCGFLVLAGLPFLVKASGESYGWFAPTVDYIDESTACPFNKFALDVSLAQINSTSTYILGSIGIWTLTIHDLDGNMLYADSYNGQLLSNQYCVDPFDNYSVQVTVNETADTFGFTSPSIKPNISYTVFPTIAKTPGSPSSHFRGYVHLQDKSGLTAAPNISSLSPDGSFLRSTPDFLVRTNRMPSIYGPSTLNSITVKSYNVSDSTQKAVTVPASGGVATRLISGMPTLTDGAYLWYYSQDFTGAQHRISIFLPVTWNYIGIPSTGQTTPLSFTVDSTPPETNLITGIDTISSVGMDKVRTNIKLDTEDTLAGLATSTLVIKRLEISGGVPIYATTSQIMTTLSGQIDLLKLNFDVTLDENEDYQFIHYLTDRAGNISVSNTFNYSTPAVATLSAPILEVRDASDIQTTQAYIPSFINSNGGSTITERGTCWSFAAMETLNLSSLPIPGVHCLADSGLNSGFPIGLYGFTHTGLPASTTIWYIGYAKNGTTISTSPWSSFKTLPDGTEISPTPALPTIGSVYSDSITANSANAIMRIDSTGGALITQRALCWRLNPGLITPAPTLGPDCYIDNTLRSGSYSLPDIFSRKFYYLPADTDIYLIGYVANSVGTTSKWSIIHTPKESLDIAQPDFLLSQTYDSSTKTYSLDFSVSATDLSNFFLPPTVLGDDRRTVPFLAKLMNWSGVVVDSINGTVKANNPANPAEPVDMIPLQFTNVAPGLYQLRVEVNDPESVYSERAASTTAGINNLRIKLLNLPDLDGGGGSPTPPLANPGFSLYFDRKIARSETPTKLYWDTKLPLDMSCKIYGGSDFGPSAIYSFNPAVDGQTGNVELNKLQNYQTFELTCVDVSAGTGLVYSTTTSITLTGSYTPI